LEDFTRAFIREGDTTTAGGTVLGGITRSMTMHGKLATFAGDPVQCPACDSIGRAECVLPYFPHTGPDGRQRSLDGDLCRCRCPLPPRLKALEHNYTMCFTRDDLVHMPGSEAWLAYAGHATALKKFDEFFVVTDRTTGRPFSGFAYGIRTQAGMYEGLLYKDGCTAKAYAEAPALMELVYLVQTEMGVRQ